MPRVAALVLLLALALPAAASASRTQESMFQDDDQLEFSPAGRVAANLDKLRTLGVDRVRVSVFWTTVAPASDKQAKPKGFDGADPDDYPNGSWDRYDTLVKLAQARGIAVAFDVTGPAPKWATGNPDRADIDATYTPDPREFAAFAVAVGKRYSGEFVPHPRSSAPPSPGNGLPPLPPLPSPGASPRQAGAAAQAPLPRIDYWEIWNEPNQAGWLTPQWLGDQPVAPALYRALADAMFAALQATGHGADTILLGATAPKGLDVRGVTRSMKPLPFIRALYCVDRHLQVLQGDAAKADGCPTADQIARFPAAHPVLFHATGWSHHPYELTFAPHQRPRDRDFSTIADLHPLSDLLRRAHARYAQPVPAGGVPLYLTEFGYQTNPPDRLGVSPATQAAYLDEAEYLAWRNRSVRTLSQFLLVDGGAPVSRTFQSGLEWADGREKPALRAYRIPLWLRRHTASRTGRLKIWGLVRPAANGHAPTVAVQFRRRRSRVWHTLATRHATAARGYLNTTVRLPGSGAVRLLWGDLASRGVTVTRRR
jgi:hypothetical protein